MSVTQISITSSYGNRTDKIIVYTHYGRDEVRFHRIFTETNNRTKSTG